MKKFLTFLSLFTSLLFTGCNSIYQNHNRSSRLIINLPHVTASSSAREIFEEAPLEKNEAEESATFTVFLTRSDGFQLNPMESTPESRANGNNQIVINELSPGIWTISASAKIEGLGTFAFLETQPITLKAGDIKTIPLALQYNLRNMITDISVSSDNTTYELGENIRTTGNTYKIHLSNGYVFSYNDREFSTAFGFSPSIEFLLDDSADEETIATFNEEVAGRFCYKIKYDFSDLTDNPIQCIVDSTINAKTPKISTQPVSTYLKYVSDSNGSQYHFEFNIELEESPLYGEIQYKWSDINLHKDYDASHETSHWEDYYLDSYKSHQGNTLVTETIQCTVTNIDEKGINGNTKVEKKSNNAILEQWTPNSDGAMNHNYIIADTRVVLANNTNYFVNNFDGAVPPASFFRIEKTIRPYSTRESTSEEVKLIYPDYDSYNIHVKLYKPDSGKDIYYFGYVPYSVSYEYSYYECLGDNGSIVSYNTTELKVQEISDPQIVYVPTQLAKIPNRNFSLDDTYYNGETYTERKCEYVSTGSDTGYVTWHVKKNDGSFEEKGDNYLTWVRGSSISDIGYYWNGTTSLQPQIIQLTESNFYYTKQLNQEKISGEIKTDISYENHTYSNVHLSLPINDCTSLKEDDELSVSLKCVTKIRNPDMYNKWIYDTSPLTETTDKVFFYKYKE